MAGPPRRLGATLPGEGVQGPGRDPDRAPEGGLAEHVRALCAWTSSFVGHMGLSWPPPEEELDHLTPCDVSMETIRPSQGPPLVLAQGQQTPAPQLTRWEMPTE